MPPLASNPPPISFPTRITRYGNSLGVRVPAVIARELQLAEGDTVQILKEQDRIVIAKVSTARSRLDALLVRVTPENLHGEVSSGQAVGREVIED